MLRWLPAGSPVVRRLARGSGANLLGKIWALLIQILSVPVLTSAWGAEGLGIWLMIVTIPVYLGLSDFGLGTAAGIDMTQAMARDDRDGALKAFQSVWIFMTGTTGLLAMAVIALAWLWGGRATLGPDAVFGPEQIVGAIILITLAALLMIQMAILKTVFQATHKYAMGTLLFDLASLVEGIVIVLVAWRGGDIVATAGGMLMVRLLALGACVVVLRRLEPWCHMGWTMADRATLRRLMRPSLAALALTVAVSFGLQGIVLTIGWSMGPAMAATFSTCRMLTRIPLQFSGLLTRASLPELTRAQVEGRRDLVYRLMHLNILLALLTMLPCIAVLVVWGPQILDRLSHGEMEANRLAFTLLGLAAILNAQWSTLGTQLLAANRHGSYAWVVLMLYAACAAAPLLLHERYAAILMVILLADAAVLVRVVNCMKHTK